MKLRPIGHIRSPYREKFGVPRQSGLVADAEAILVLEPPFHRPEALMGLEDFSHVWLIWRFHQVVREDQDFRPTVRPPRLGGNRRFGVFATRSPYRPNHLGLSAVKLLTVEPKACRLVLGGVDLVDGTPIYDIKPYVPYADAVAEASGGFADRAPDEGLVVSFSSQAQAALVGRERLRRLIRQTLALDPRPAFHEDSRRVYVMALEEVEVRWRVIDHGAWVLEITAVPADH